MTIFNKINEFIEFKKHCPLCRAPLTPFLRDTIGRNPYHPKIPYLNAPLRGDKFIFTISYVPQSVYFQPPPNSCSININSNIFYVDCILNLDDIKNIFDNMFVIVELSCFNKKCKHNYCIMSHVLKYSVIGEEMIISNISLDFEYFKMPLWYILNDFNNKTTNIYNGLKNNSRDDSNEGAISAPLLDIFSLGKEKYFNKIKMLVNFS